ncbi:MAG: RNA polymerase sigma factor [Balneolaceae bacterium]|nr:RNA polymerase sigma factor [Balneolaceae bacterium]
MMKVKQGDLDKLGLLFERYNRPLFSFFYRMCKESQLSEDLVQSVFERMLKYRSTYSGNGAFTTWMFSIARNAHIDHYRKQKRRAESDEELDEERVGTAPPEYAERDGKIRRKEILEQALDQLDDDKKEVIVLSRYEGLKYKEIAKIQDSTEGAVKVKVFRAIKELRDIVTTLSEEYSDE